MDVLYACSGEEGTPCEVDLEYLLLCFQESGMDHMLLNNIQDQVEGQGFYIGSHDSGSYAIIRMPG